MRCGKIEELTGTVFSVEPLVSIIVPIYNVPEGRLRRCVASILDQSYAQLEVILVDDGSDADHMPAVESVAGNDARIRLIASRHGGVSHARNAGIDAARGDWVAFVDADDVVLPGFVEDGLKAAHSTGADFVCGAVCYEFADGVVKGAVQDGAYCVIDGARSLASAARQMLGNAKLASVAFPDFRSRGLHAKLYKSNTAKGLRFDESIAIGEDTLFNYHYIGKCRSMVIVDCVWYRYYQYAGSAFHAPDLSPWETSIDGLMAAGTRSGTDLDAYAARCAIMAFQGVESFARSVSIPVAFETGLELLRHARLAGCFPLTLFDGYDIHQWRLYRDAVAQSKKGHLRVACAVIIARARLRDARHRTDLIREEDIG